MARKPRSSVKIPLKPAVLEALGALDWEDLKQKPFDAQSDWINTYRIWVCHGYHESGNDDVGFLKIERINKNKSFSLIIDQTIIHSESPLHIVHAEIQCNNDALASPQHWTLSSRFVNPENEDRSELDLHESVTVEDKQLTVTSNGKTFTRKKPDSFTSDFCLFEAIQRMSFSDQSPLMFDVYEGLSLLKKNHQLLYHGNYALDIQERHIDLKEFHHTGNGILPYNYWLNKHHRLLAVTTLSRAYILDEHAVEKTETVLKEKRKFYQKKKKRMVKAG